MSADDINVMESGYPVGTAAERTLSRLVMPSKARVKERTNRAASVSVALVADLHEEAAERRRREGDVDVLLNPGVVGDLELEAQALSALEAVDDLQGIADHDVVLDLQRAEGADEAPRGVAPEGADVEAREGAAALVDGEAAGKGADELAGPRGGGADREGEDLCDDGAGGQVRDTEVEVRGRDDAAARVGSGACLAAGGGVCARRDGGSAGEGSKENVCELHFCGGGGGCDRKCL
ncbi:hypothetical protein CH63R_09155 [Colletotrichum higginsianum IMI 349063]|uniref:Uncharacterized protein n=1 Tax=Colletotrichum higginsianum (strain IMI 349063) TaxID=759273 RepID=A0A1B7Y6K1_COLHI|nr:hypothetical protein CH63R_09155 [Colletotrichum higginsianum IMI 349063]OBR07634.1 hypothetical protein CH63R_09155 [Colletotrichum higginsianum IMI 349063]